MDICLTKEDGHCDSWSAAHSSRSRGGHTSARCTIVAIEVEGSLGKG